MEADGRASVTEIEGEEQTATTTKNMVEPAGLDTSLDEMTGGGVTWDGSSRLICRCLQSAGGVVDLSAKLGAAERGMSSR